MTVKSPQLVQDILNAVRDGLGPYVLRQYKVTFSGKQYLARLQEKLDFESLQDEAEALEELDLSAWLNAIEAEWDGIFSNRLGRRTRGMRRGPDSANARNFLYELRNARNRWAHPRRNSRFTDEDVFRLADTATRLLKIIKAGPEAAKIEEIRSQLGRRLYAIKSETNADSAPSNQTLSLTVEDDQKDTDPTNQSPNIIGQNQESTLDLSGKDLRKWNLKAGKLQSANLSRANLAGANLAVSNFHNARLTGANLTRANLAGAVLTGANLVGELLRGARSEPTFPLTFEEMYGEDWDDEETDETFPWEIEGVTVQNSTRAEARGLNVPPFVDYFVLTDFSGANLAGADLRDVDFCSALYDEMLEVFNVVAIVTFRNANLTDADLSGAAILMADFREVDLSDCKLESAHIGSANFEGAKMTRANLSGDIPPHTPWGEVEAVFNRADLTNADLSKSYLCGCEFNDAKLNCANCSKTDFSGSSFQRGELSSIVLEFADLSYANLDEAILNKADLSGASMSRSRMHDADLTEANLSRAVLEEAQLLRANFTKANLTGANLDSANLNGAILCDADLSEANLTGADLTGTDLTGANLMDANLESAILKDAKLESAKFRFNTKLPDGSFWTDETDMSRFTI